MTPFFFSLLYSIGLGSISLLTVLNNPVHSLLLLILVFIIGTVLLLMIHIDFLAFIFFMIYIGAVVVLFLFVVMMVDIKVSVLHKLINSPISIRAFFVNITLILLLLCYDFNNTSFYLSIINNANINQLMQGWSLYIEHIDFFSIIERTTVLEALGRSLYRYESTSFLIAGIILYISMIGAIFLTINRRGPLSSKMQNALKQTFQKTRIHWLKIKN